MVCSGILGYSLHSLALIIIMINRLAKNNYICLLSAIKLEGWSLLMRKKLCTEAVMLLMTRYVEINKHDINIINS